MELEGAYSKDNVREIVRRGMPLLGFSLVVGIAFAVVMSVYQDPTHAFIVFKIVLPITVPVCILVMYLSIRRSKKLLLSKRFYLDEHELRVADYRREVSMKLSEIKKMKEYRKGLIIKGGGKSISILKQMDRYQKFKSELERRTDC